MLEGGGVGGLTIKAEGGSGEGGWGDGGSDLCCPQLDNDNGSNVVYCDDDNDDDGDII